MTEPVTTTPRAKVAFPVDRRFWHPSPFIGQVTLVTTLNSDGGSNVAPKSLISMMTFAPAILALGCNLTHWTAKNILRDREFVVNVPGEELALAVWRASDLPHPRPVEVVGLTAIAAERLRPPRIEECRAHFECTLDRHIAYGDEVVFLGRIVAASLDRVVAEAADPYAEMRMFGFLEDRTYGVVERSIRLPRP